ncbi:FlgD immunoglobulin-like domain containing protein [Rhodocaloribacter sp.]
MKLPLRILGLVAVGLVLVLYFGFTDRKSPTAEATTIPSDVLFSPAFLGSPRVPDGTYRINNHPDGNARPPTYCLRLDKLFGNFSTITFDCEHPDADLEMVVDGSTVTISGTVFGGRDRGSDYDPNESGLWTLNFTFINTETAAGDDDLIVPPASPNNGSGTIVPQFSTTSGTVVAGTVYNLIDYDGSWPYTFRLGDKNNDAGHRGYDGISGWGWLKYCKGASCTNFKRPDTSDWLFTAEKICADEEAPSWDGNVDVDETTGQGTLTVLAPNGLKDIELVDPSSNIVLVDVLDENGVSLIGPDGFVGIGFTEGTENDGYDEFEFTGSNEFAPTEVQVVIGAPEMASSSFFIELTDCCNKTLRVDPKFSLYSIATATDTEDSEEIALPTSFQLEQNYPNPFNPTTTIPFELAESAQVRLTVLDLLGREVQTLVQGSLPAGRHQASWDGRNAAGSPVPSGIYFYRLETGATAQTRRMMMIK